MNKLKSFESKFINVQLKRNNEGIVNNETKNHVVALLRDSTDGSFKLHCSHAPIVRASYFAPLLLPISIEISLRLYVLHERNHDQSLLKNDKKPKFDEMAQNNVFFMVRSRKITEN